MSEKILFSLENCKKCTQTKEIPNYYLRTLYGDPEFNPYEPNNGFNNQSIPISIQ